MYPSLFTVVVYRVVHTPQCGQLHYPQLCASKGRVGARRRPTALCLPVARASLLKFVPLSCATRVINVVDTKIVIFNYNLPKFTEIEQNFIISEINS